MNEMSARALTMEELENVNGGKVTIQDILKSTTAILMFPWTHRGQVPQVHQENKKPLSLCKDYYSVLEIKIQNAFFCLVPIHDNRNNIKFYFSTYPVTHLPTYDKKVFYRYWEKGGGWSPVAASSSPRVSIWRMSSPPPASSSPATTALARKWSVWPQLLVRWRIPTLRQAQGPNQIPTLRQAQGPYTMAAVSSRLQPILKTISQRKLQLGGSSA